MKRLISLFLFACLLCTVCACGGEPPADVPGDTSAPETTAAPAMMPVDMGQYRIVRADKGSAEETSAATRLYSALLAQFGNAPELTTDWVRTEADIPVDTPEILVGATNRAESKEFAEGLLAEDYVIAVSGRRVVILGGSPAKTAEAVEYFIDTYVGTETELALPADLHFLTAGNYPAEITVAGQPIAEYCVVIPAGSDRYTAYAAELFCEAVRAACGASLAVIEDSTPVAPREIRLGKTARSGAGEGAVVFDGANLCIGQASADSSELVRTVRGLIAHHLSDLDYETKIDFNADIPINCTLAALDIPEIPLLDGKRAVALTDQKNAEVAVIDLDAADPAAKEAVLWHWTPTTSLGYNTDGFGTSVDEAKLRYDGVNGRFLLCVTSSAGFMGITSFPDGACVWNTTEKIGPHSIELLPGGNVAVASSGNGDDTVAGIRVYAASQGKNNRTYAEVLLPGAHGVVWDDTLGVLWGLGHTQVCAYRIGGTDSYPTITEVESLRIDLSCKSGHDLQTDPTDPTVMWVAAAKLLRVDKTTGQCTEMKAPVFVKGTKSIGNFPDGTVVRSAATKVYKDHDTDTLTVLIPKESGDWETKKIIFSDRAFYKARILSPAY